ncbi:MAG: hypothetical protein ACXVB6_12565, partial [Mucilaginibacter sp.]
MKKYSIINAIFLQITLLVIYLGLIGFTNKFILTVDFYERNGQPVSGIPEMELIVYQNIKHCIYFYSAFYLIGKLFLITLILYAGLYYSDMNVSFRDILRIVTQAEFIFLIPAIVKIWWFYYYGYNDSLEQWQSFYFLSAASLMDYIKPVFLYPLQCFNAFELSYWFILASGIKSLTGIGFDRSLKVVLISYVPALLTW